MKEKHGSFIQTLFSKRIKENAGINYSIGIKLSQCVAIDLSRDGKFVLILVHFIF